MAQSFRKSSFIVFYLWKKEYKEYIVKIANAALKGLCFTYWNSLLKNPGASYTAYLAFSLNVLIDGRSILIMFLLMLPLVLGACPSTFFYQSFQFSLIYYFSYSNDLSDASFFNDFYQFYQRSFVDILGFY